MFLDEPTTGLDPRSRNQVWDIIRALAGAGTCILLCTQYLDEADQLADGIAVIDQGKVIAEEPRHSSRPPSARAPARPGCSIPSSARAPNRSWRAPSAPRSTSSPTPPHSRPLARTRIRPPRSSVSSDAPRSPSPASRSDSRASMRSSSRSPGTPPRGSQQRRHRDPGPTSNESLLGFAFGGALASHEHARDQDNAGTDPAGARPQQGAHHLAPAEGRRSVSRPDLRLARDAEGEARAGAARRRDDHARDVRPPLHLPVRRGDRGIDRRLPRLHHARGPGHRRPRHDRLLRNLPPADITKGVVDRFLRCRSGPPPARRRAAGRQRALPGLLDGDHRPRADPRLPAGGGVPGVLGTVAWS